jgi:hypothetical protein
MGEAQARRRRGERCVGEVMPRRAYCLVTVAFSIALMTGHANAQAERLLGEWRQVESNAGACPTCQISIGGDASLLTVTANNGWSAAVVAGEKNNVMGATGSGRWNSRADKSIANKPFNIVFIVKGVRLYMTMFIDGANGSRQAVKGVFERPWLGS